MKTRKTDRRRRGRCEEKRREIIRKENIKTSKSGDEGNYRT